jgi:hypothetical protein
MAEAKLEHRGDNDVEKRQANKQASSQQASTQAVGSVNQAGEKMKKDCSLSRLEHDRRERHHLVN